MHTKDRLAAELRKIGLEAMATAAAAGYYDDFLAWIDLPINQLVADLTLAGSQEAMALRARVIDGDFDATAEESEAWANSPEGQQAFSKLKRGE